MRITNPMLSGTVLTNLNNDLQWLQKAQNQMSSGLAVSKPSDDPVAAGRILTLQSTLAAQQRYSGNLGDAAGFLNASDTALSDISSALNRVRELMLQGATGTMNDEDRVAAGDEVDQLIDQLVEIGNSMSGSQYIFGGYKTTQPPLTRSGDIVTYNGDDGQINYEVAQGVRMTVNIDGSSLFQQVTPASTDEGNTDLFNTLAEIKNDLLNNTNISDLGGSLLTKLDQLGDHVSAEQSVVGARANRVNIAKSRNASNQQQVTTVLSNTQDIDMAKAAVDFSQRYYVYQAALSTAANIIQRSLVDYLNI
jgi:flagellar hook-associated protein 3 FlgL